ncbi:MAG TPA: diaminopimelate decarboxylase, partial [Thermaerobacter sp.]
VGRYCESGDIVIPELDLPVVEPGDVVAVFSTGAYNYSMSSQYNRFPRPAMVLVQDGEAEIIVERETYEDLMRHDRIPPSLKGGA